MLKIMLVDDQASVREGLMMRLSLEPGICILSETGDIVRAVKAALELKPDLIIMDIEMSDSNLDGVMATQAIKARLPQIVIIILTIHDHKSQREKALKAGADVFLAKTRIEDLVDILRQEVRNKVC